MAERGKNFSDFEKEVLLAEIDRCKHTILTKSTKASANYEKTAAWYEITRRFNCTPGVNRRRVSQLQCFWNNLKRRAMKRKAKNRVGLLTTGGGPSKNNLVSTGMIRNPLSEIYDDDHDYQATETSPPPSETEMTANEESYFSDSIDPYSETEESINHPEDLGATEQPDSSDINFSRETPEFKKIPISRWKMKRKKKTPCITLAEIAEDQKVATEQMKLKINLEIELRREEHELLMQQRREEHALNMQIKQQQHDLQLAIMNEKLSLLKALRESAVNGTFKGRID